MVVQNDEMLRSWMSARVQVIWQENKNAQEHT